MNKYTRLFALLLLLSIILYQALHYTNYDRFSLFSIVTCICYFQTFHFHSQRNPSTIRIAEENKGKDIYDMDLNIDVTKSSKLSPHLFNFCTIASKPLKVFANELDLKAWANSKSKFYKI